MKKENLWGLWIEMKSWQKILILIVGLSALISIILYNNNVSNLYAKTLAIIFLLFVLAIFILFGWLDTRSPNKYWKTGFIITTIYSLLTIFITGTAGGGIEGGSSILLMMPFSGIIFLLILNLQHISIIEFHIMSLLNLIIWILLGMFIVFMIDKIKNKIRW